MASIPTNPGAIVCDIDGTLCPIKLKNANYKDLQPYPKIVEKLRQCREDGFHITLFTARNMRTYDGDIESIRKNTLPIIMEWLSLHDIPYDDVIVGKPWPGHDGVYVDDRSVRPFEFMSMDIEELHTLIDRERSKHIAAEEDKIKPKATNIVITMAGHGSRFAKAGYSKPKYELEAHGHSSLEWSLISLKNFFKRPYRLIFIALADHQCTSFLQRTCRKLGLNIHSVIELDSVTNGQATTALRAKEAWEPNSPLLIYNIDTFVEPQELKPVDIRQSSNAWIPCFKAQGDHWSFVKTGDDGWATDVAEKRCISENATIGLYWFSKAHSFETLYELHFSRVDIIDAGEFYIAPMYRTMIKAGGHISISQVNVESVHPLGTPDELEIFKAGQPPGG